MSSSPAPPDPRTAPLDAEEQALAQALRGLPAAAPSAELDARVMAMARAALAQPPHSAANSARRPRRRALWWMSSAAGAVLAAGIGWQLGQDAGGLPSASAPAPQGAQMRPAEQEDSASLDVEIIRRSAPPISPAPAPSASADVEASSPRARSVERASQAAAPVAAHAPAVSMPPPSAPAPITAPLREQADAIAAEPTPSRDANAAKAEDKDAQGSDLDRIIVTGTRVDAARLDAEGFPPLASDARLTPELWLERIRARRAAGQSDAARRSLKIFVRSYPYLVVPDDLRSLLNESP
jgi:hypothetical protein